MPFAVVCPKCKVDYQVPDHLLGKPIGCRKCDFLFRASPPASKAQPAPRPALPVPAAQTSPTANASTTAVLEPEPILEIMEEGAPAAVEMEPIIPIVIEDSENAPRAPTRRHRRPVTWGDLEHKKRYRDPDAEPERDYRKPVNPVDGRIPPLKMALWVAGGVLILALLVGAGVAMYYVSKPKTPKPEKTSGVTELPPEVPGVEPTTIASLGEPFGIQPPEFEGENLSIELGGQIDILCVGGGGRFIVLKIARKNELHIFDVNVAKVVKTIAIPGNAKFAAGARKLVIFNPEQSALQRFDLLKHEFDLEVPVPENEKVKEIVMGSASDGPVLEVGSTRADVIRGSDRIRFLDLETLTAIPIRNIPRIGPGPRQFRASADGKVFAHWATNVPVGNGQILAISGDEVQAFTSSASPLIPSANGQVVYSFMGTFSKDLKLLKGPAQFGNPCKVPSVHGNYYLNIALDQAVVAPNPKDLGNVQNSICKFTPTTAAGQAICQPLTMPFPLPTLPNTQDPLGADRRAIFIPAAKVLAVIPASSDRLILYRIDLEKLLEASDPDYLVVTSTAPNGYQLGRTYSYPLEVVSKNGGVKFKLVQGPEGMTVTRDAVISWPVPPNFVRREVVVDVELTDSKSIQARIPQIRLTMDDLGGKNP
jgi:hypothetical protein